MDFQENEVYNCCRPSHGPWLLSLVILAGREREGRERQNGRVGVQEREGGPLAHTKRLSSQDGKV